MQHLVEPVEQPSQQVIDLARLVEALLFVADEPVNVSDLAETLEVGADQIQQALDWLVAQGRDRGVAVTRVGMRVQMVTAAEAAPAVARFLGMDRTTRLSAAAMETVAVIAYRQPVTRAQVEAIRGVNSDGVIRTLRARNLIETVGQLEQAGRPELLGTTFEFLRYFGLESLDMLPRFPELEDSLPSAPQD
ncbi:MAG: SMC-Scp complex subunit ScpB [Anaerolineae bacterium]|jgi:segregation and condensation protein B|nr:SMC-Scp complex subunit ScpB [Chloroflexota bacterium]